MAVQSEAALENALIHALEQMSYEYVKIEEESNLRDNFNASSKNIIANNLRK